MAESRRLVFGGACFFLVFLAASATSVEYCDRQKNYPVKVSGVEINPNPVVRGEAAKFSISAVTESALAGGKLVIDVNYFGFHVHEETHSLCGETSCPVTGGDFVISHEQVLPNYTPPGSYTLMMKLFGENDRLLTCVRFGFSVGFLSEVADE